MQNFLNFTQNAVISFGGLVGCLIVAFTVVQGKRQVGEFVMCKPSFPVGDVFTQLKRLLVQS
jgi:ABC-type transport system involved in Fe-S cluster assembly fused permease/ATPase subunit